MSFMLVQSESAEVGLPSADELRSSGIRNGAGSTSYKPEVWLRRKLADSTKKLSEASGKEAEKSDNVYLVDGLPPLSKKTVEMNKRGDFVEFFGFSVSTGVVNKEKRVQDAQRERESVSSDSQGGKAKKKGISEVPDAPWWGTCFSLYEAAHVKAKPELAETI